MDVSAVDLFCGTGGLTNGLERAGISVEAGIDVNSDCRFPYEENNDATFLASDIGRIAREEPEVIAEHFDDEAEATLLAGCAPCQPFSPLTHGADSTDHDKYGMLRAFLEIVRHTRPDFVVMKNVYEIRNADVYDEFVDSLEVLGYNLNPDTDKRVYCPEYGIPQTRRRWVLVASRDGRIDLGEPSHPNPDEYPTVEGCIDHLPAIEAGETHSKDPLHTSRRLTNKNLQRIRQSEPGGDWTDWDDDLLLECHKKSSGQSYKSVYGRMVANEPAPTITTQFYNLGSGRFGHYDTDQDRAISLREGAMIQTFPEDYRFVNESDEIELNKIGRLIGNAVPPKLGEVIGERVIEFIEWSDRQSSLTDFSMKTLTQ